MQQRRGGTLFRPRRRRNYGCLTLLLALLAVLALVFSLNALSNRFVRIDTQRVTVLSLPPALEGFSILHLSDLNAASLGDKQENLANTIKDLDYRAVALTGDMVGKSGQAQPLMDLLAAIKPGTPVFLLAGGSDPAPLVTQPHGDSQVYAPWVQAAVAKGAIYLETPYFMQADGQGLWFCPADLFTLDLDNARFALNEQINMLQASSNPYEAQTGAQLRVAQHRLDVINRSQELLAQMKPQDIIIALSHIPPDGDELARLSTESREMGLSSPSLFLAGQFNNGQMRLPGLGPLFIPRQMDGRGGFLPGDEGFVGLDIKKGYALHISPGLGVSAYYPLPIRLFNRPAGTLLILTARMTR